MPRASGCISLGLVLGLLAGAAQAAPITYQVNRTIGLGSVTGSIETDGATGVLGGANILAWDLELNGNAASYHLTSGMSGNSAVVLSGSDLSATAGSLLFDFGGTDGGYLLFQDGLYSGNHYYCDQAGPSGPCYLGESVVPEAFDSPSAQTVLRTDTEVIGRVVPEPGALALGAIYLAGIALAMRRREHQS